MASDETSGSWSSLFYHNDRAAQIWIHLMMCFTHFCHITKPMLKQNKKHFLFQLFYLMINEQYASKQSIAKQSNNNSWASPSKTCEQQRYILDCIFMQTGQCHCRLLHTLGEKQSWSWVVSKIIAANRFYGIFHWDFRPKKLKQVNTATETS